MATQEEAELCFPQLNSSCRKPTLHWSKAVLLNTVLSFICLTTVFLNLLIIISISQFRKLHTTTNILLLSLAVSDFLVGLLLMPGEILRSTTCWFLGDVICYVYFYLVCLIICGSIGNIVLISVDRYVAICHPLHYATRITLGRVKCCICLCWLGAGFYSIFYVKDDLIQPGRGKSCFGECTFILSYLTGTIDLILTFIIPVSIIILLYMRVFVVAVSQARAMRSHITAVTLHCSANPATKRSELKAARTLGVLIVVYLTCYCPYYTYSLIRTNVTSTKYASFFIFLFYFNSCLNPVIYALFYPWFRKAIKVIVTLQILQPGSCDVNIL
ncbi:trace amine-associated receptor 13c-like [Girardinichthys multiradiatus]|uniref:trace amine-associated receptor 13c-like n=1 Tax=Girardinichthys multiradiatus TaxID=208333 RepID=UPI001FAE0E70|nr:trace amine-associated receptor 13c-like [Girardinichthys multiradiatus]